MEIVSFYLFQLKTMSKIHSVSPPSVCTSMFLLLSQPHVIHSVFWMMPGGSVIFDPAPVSWIKVVGKSPTHPLHPELSQAGELKQTLLFLLLFLQFFSGFDSVWHCSSWCNCFCHTLDCVLQRNWYLLNSSGDLAIIEIEIDC